jgi:hypothetical protein
MIRSGRSAFTTARKNTPLPGASVESIFIMTRQVACAPID